LIFDLGTFDASDLDVSSEGSLMITRTVTISSTVADFYLELGSSVVLARATWSRGAIFMDSSGRCIVLQPDCRSWDIMWKTICVCRSRPILDAFEAMFVYNSPDLCVVKISHTMWSSTSLRFQGEDNRWNGRPFRFPRQDVTKCQPGDAPLPSSRHCI